MAGGQNNPRAQDVTLRRLAEQLPRQAGDERDPWRPILTDVAGDSTRWALALAAAEQVTGIPPERLHGLDPEEMETYAAAARAWLLDNPPTSRKRGIPAR